MKIFFYRSPLTAVLIIAVIISIAITIYTVKTFVPIINDTVTFNNTHDYPWVLLYYDGNLSIKPYSIGVPFTNAPEHFYLQLFDNGASRPPSDLLKEVAQIPSGAKKIQFDFDLVFPPGVEVTCYIMQFDEHKLLEKSLKSEKVTPNTFKFKLPSMLGKPYSIKANIHPSALTYKILFSIRPNGSTGSIGFQSIDIKFI